MVDQRLIVAHPALRPQLPRPGRGQQQTVQPGLRQALARQPALHGGAMGQAMAFAEVPRGLQQGLGAQHRPTRRRHFTGQQPAQGRSFGKACRHDIAAAVDFVGSESSSSLAVNLVRRTGQVVIVGLFGGEFRMPLPMFALKSLRIGGSYVGSLADLRELVALAQRIMLPQTPLDVRPLAQVNQALQDLAAGRVVGRVVLEP